MSSESGTYSCTLSPALLEKAKAELNEDPQTRHLETKSLKERLEKVPGYKGRLDGEFLLRFLRCKKFNQERAFQQVLTYYRMKKENPDIFENLTPKAVEHILEAGVTGVLHDRMPDGSKVIIFRPGKWDPDKGTLSQVFANNFLTMLKLIEDEETQICGITMLADLSDLGWQQAKHISPFYARKIASLIQDAFPARFKGIHYWKEPTFFDVVFTIVKQFLKEKMLKRIHLHGDKPEKLQEYFPPDMLPEDFGGRLPRYSNREWKDLLLSCEAQFAEECKYGLVDLTIPAKDSKKQDATESLGGTFRKLNLD